MKKLLLNLGAIALVSAPITTIVACGNNSDKETQEEEKLEPTPSEGDTQPKPEATPSKKTAEVGKKEEKKLPAISEFQMRENIYYWKPVPDVLKNKSKEDAVSLKDLGLSKSAFWSLKSTDDNSIDDSSVEIKINVKTKLEGNKIVLTVNLQQGEHTSKKSKDITINYNFLTFEAVKNATNNNLKEILKIVGDDSKPIGEQLGDIKDLKWEDKDKELFENYWNHVDVVSGSKEVYHMLNFMKASTSFDGITLASVGVIDKKDGVKLSQDDKFLLMKRKIFNAKFDIKEVARGIINRFLLQDPDLKPDAIGYAAKADDEGQKLIAKDGWGGATVTMGGDETIQFILNTIGYKLVVPEEN